MFRIVAVVSVMIALAGTVSAQDSFTYEGGGLKDSGTRLVWGESLKSSTGSWWTWNPGADMVDAHSVTVDGTTYDDWRMPAVAEMLDLINFNPELLEALVPTNEDGSPWYASIDVWTGDTRGSSAYTVHLEFVRVYDESVQPPVFLYFYLDQAASGSTNLIKKDSLATEIYTVRDPYATSAGGGSGKKN